MFRTTTRIAVLALVLGWGTPAFADTIVWSGSGGWTTGWLANNDGAEFWDQPSHDGTNCNIGFYLTGTLGVCGNQSGPSEPALVDPSVHGYLNDGAGNALSDIWVISSGDMMAGLVLEIAGLRDGNAFGYYNRANPTEQVVLFAGLDAPPAAVTFNPFATHGWVEYGFFLTSTTNTFFSESSLNTGTESGRQHFAFFQGPGGAYFIGVEDLPLGTSDRDYNDMAIRVQRQAVPEPTTTALLGLGLLGMATFMRRRQ